MKARFGAKPEARHGERGSSTVKFIVILAVVGALIYIGIQYVPTAYRFSNYKKYMQESVNTAAISGKSSDWVREQLQSSENDYGVPREAKISTLVQNSRIVATVQFTYPINLLPG